MAKRVRKLKSFKEELLIKSREAMLSAVQIFNNPNIHFKSSPVVCVLTKHTDFSYNLPYNEWKTITIEKLNNP